MKKVEKTIKDFAVDLGHLYRKTTVDVGLTDDQSWLTGEVKTTTLIEVELNNSDNFYVTVYHTEPDFTFDLSYVTGFPERVLELEPILSDRTGVTEDEVVAMLEAIRKVPM